MLPIHEWRSGRSSGGGSRKLMRPSTMPMATFWPLDRRSLNPA
jgi:hypothetical protein